MPGLIFVALGGALGASARYGVAVGFSHYLPGRLWPWATLLVNLVGCLLIGLVLGALRSGPISESPRLFFVTGILGGLTTFSSFGAESFSLVESGHWVLAATYVVASILGGLSAVWLGFAIHR